MNDQHVVEQRNECASGANRGADSSRSHADGDQNNTTTGTGQSSYRNDHDPIPTRSQPVPLEEGPGEQVGTGLSSHPLGVPGTNGNRSGTGTLQWFERGERKLLPLATTSHMSNALALRGQGRGPCNTWVPFDPYQTLLPLLDGSYEVTAPTVGGWLYTGAVNGLAGESGCGKTWTALATVGHELLAGNSVVYLDFEDSPNGIYKRLLDMGISPDILLNPNRFAYIHPEEAFKDDVRPYLWAVTDRMNPSLLVLDSTGESMALEGVDPNSDDAVARWFQRVARAIADRGIAVLLIDHLPKNGLG